MRLLALILVLAGPALAQREVLGRCLVDLPHLHRSVLHLHYWMGMTVKEISHALATPEGTIKSYMHRGRARLGELLARKGVTHV